MYRRLLITGLLLLAIPMLAESWKNRSNEGSWASAWFSEAQRGQRGWLRRNALDSTLKRGDSEGSAGNATDPLPDESALSAAEVESMVDAAVQALGDDNYAVAVVDRAGRILAVWQKPGASFEAAEKAVALARTGGFFSNDQAPLSSRTVRFISGINFPPGIKFQPVAALYGIENTNRGCDFNTTFNPLHFVPRARSLSSFLREEGLQSGEQLPCNNLHQRGCSPGPYTGKFSGTFSEGRLREIPDEELFDLLPQQVHGGGIPIFKDCRVAGGIGVFGTVPDHAEFAALVGSLSGNPSGGSPSFGPVACLSPPFAVLVEGVRLPFVAGTSRPAGTAPGSRRGAYLVSPRDGGVLADGWLVGGPDAPKAGSALSSDDVIRIVEQAIASADETRAAIRLPLGSRAKMVIAVSDLDGTLLALNRMPDATAFSIDVAVAKSRNVIFFSRGLRDADLPGVPSDTAITNRTISFGAQPLYPPGITGNDPGPFFDLFRFDLENPCTQGEDSSNRANINGVVFFPGSVPLYSNGRLVGGLGISGDGVEQDDVVAAFGGVGFEAPDEIRADQFFVGGLRLPYLRFSRNPGS